MKKKIVAVVTAVAMTAMMLAGCGSSAQQESGQTQETEEAVEDAQAQEPAAEEPAAEDAPELAAVEVLLLEQPDRVRTPAAAMTLIIEIKVLRFIVKILS